MSDITIDKLNKRLRTEEIEDKILSLITDTPYEIGAKLPIESQLCELFGVGRSTVREALKSLESRRVVYIKQGSGTYVKSWVPTDMDPLGIMRAKNKLKIALDLVNVRIMLEPKIAALAAENANDEDKQKIKYNADKVEELISQGSDYLKYDIDFHSSIAKASRNEVVEQLIPMIDTAVMMFVNVTHKKLQEETIRTHRDITNAILEGSPSKAEAAMTLHLLYNRQSISAMYEESRKKKSYF